jgi:cytochrome c biogenesis protein CcdA
VSPGPALREVYHRPGYLAAAVILALLSATVLAWSGQLITVFPQGGVFIDADAGTVLGLGGAAVLLGVTLPLHWFAWRRSAGTAAAQGMGILGTVFSVGSLSCCAPLLVPGLLGLLGFSGSSLLALNLRLHQIRLPLTLLALAFLTSSFLMGVANVTRSCSLPRRRRLPAA